MVQQTSTTSSAGAGQFNPSSATSSVQVIEFQVQQMLLRLNTMKLVKVIAVTGGGGAIARAGTVDVQPLVSQVDGNMNVVPHGNVNGIPWFRLQGGDGAIICDPQVGDLGYVIVADRDISSVKSAAAAGNDPVTVPGSQRSFSLSDGIYVGGSLNDTPVQYIAYTATGLLIVDRNGNVVQTSPSGMEFTPATGVLKVNGNIHATGEVYSHFGLPGQNGLSTHLHTSGSAGFPTSTPTPGT